MVLLLEKKCNVGGWKSVIVENIAVLLYFELLNTTKENQGHGVSGRVNSCVQNSLGL